MSMELGMISWITEDCFAEAKAKGLEFIELDVNDRAEEFLENAAQLKEYVAKYDMPVLAVGRWGSSRIAKDGILQEELALECRLIEAAAPLGCRVYITGCNYVEELSYYENCTLAIQYFEKLIECGKKYGIKIATYNCRWNSFVCDDTAYRMIHGHLKDLYIKYDPSHGMSYGDGDYLKEMTRWAYRFAHVHLKGVVMSENRLWDSPPAGMDMVNWPAVLAILYTVGYEGALSIEPHSGKWMGELGDKGLNRTIEYFRNLKL